MTVMPLGRVLGLLLDRHASTEPGQATVIHESDEEGTERCRLLWHSSSVWRMERDGGGAVSDGRQTQEWQGTRRWPAHPTRQGHPDPATGFVGEASFLSGRRTLRLVDLRQGPLDDAASLFTIST